MSNWIFHHLGPDVPIHFTAFHPDYHLLDHPPTSQSTLSHARQIAKKQGLHHVYTGNVHDLQGGSTFCSQCGQLLIERNWYEIRQYLLKDRDKCPQCGSTCVGFFEGQQGSWGAKRKSIHL